MSRFKKMLAELGARPGRKPSDRIAGPAPQAEALARSTDDDTQYRQLVTSPPGGAVFKSRSTIFGAYIW